MERLRKSLMMEAPTENTDYDDLVVMVTVNVSYKRRTQARLLRYRRTHSYASHPGVFTVLLQSGEVVEVTPNAIEPLSALEQLAMQAE